MPLRRKRKSKIVAPATVFFTQFPNDRGHKQLCVFAECHYGGTRVGPVWSHSDAAIRRALATLTLKCDCGRSFHKNRYQEGHRIKIESRHSR
jgi:hypothetical protein